jgi:hypothetical protein
MYEKNRFSSFNGLGHYYGQTETPLKEMQSVLPPSIAIDTKEVKEQIQDPANYIPQKNDVIGWEAARKFLRRPVGSAPKVTPVPKTKGGVYWTAGGPKFSQKPISGGGRAENVQAPEVVLKPTVSIVRDKPRIDLPPIQMPSESSFKGLGELSVVKVGLPVLCLIIVGFLLYRR